MRGEGVSKQMRTVLHFSAFGGLLAEFGGAVDVLRVDTRFRPVHLCIRVKPVVAVWCNVVGQLRITLDGGAIRHRVTAVTCIDGLWVFRLLRRVVVIAQRAAQRLGAVDFPAAFRQHIIDGFIVWRGGAVALT
ncbi:hypothetical protein D3C80_1352070 [compost metagenome]